MEKCNSWFISVSGHTERHAAKTKQQGLVVLEGGWGGSVYEVAFGFGIMGKEMRQWYFVVYLLRLVFFASYWLVWIS